MKKVLGVSFSYADNSLQTRGLSLLADNIPNMKVKSMLDYNMPICNSNKSDGVVPESVDQFNNDLKEADVIVFAISEATSHYSAGFKNAMDWLVVKTQFNANLGNDYSITDKPIMVITFTPCTKSEANNGGRHFDMTTHLLNKLGSNIIDAVVIHDAWNTILPNTYDAVEQPIANLKSFIALYTPTSRISNELTKNSNQRWLESYELWDNEWKK